MKETKIWQKLILTHALVLGLSLCIIEFIALYLGMIFNQYLGNIFQILVILIAMNAVRKHRDHNLKGSITFLQVFITSFALCAISGIIWATYRFFQYLYVPQIVKEMINLSIEAIELSGMSSANKEFFINSTKLFTSASTLSFINTFFINMILGGSILSLLLGLLFKKKPNPVNP